MDRPLIVGAGPVGLGAALFLARQNIAARLIELRAEPATQSKALAVNPRTLDMLEPTGVTAKMLEMGKPIRGMQFHRGGKIVAQVALDGIHPRYPFLLGLSQATTERLLAEAFLAAGGTVERCIEMTTCRNTPDGVEATLRRVGEEATETVRTPWLLAADGAHSTARRDMGVEFRGDSFKEPWYLCDVRLRTNLSEDFGHITFLSDNRFLFLLRTVDDVRCAEPEGPLWRVLGNFPEPLSLLTEAEPLGGPLWSSSFRVAHKVDAELSRGNVYFAGDAAHVHSPMGARGMNLGLEDAYVFAHLAAAGRLADYHNLRHGVDVRVVDQVRFFSNLMSSTAWPLDLVRRHVLPHVVKTPLAGRIKRTVTGLDHALPA